MSTFLLLSFLQGAVILFDEFYFHRRRGLPKWEVIGHPVDTLTVILCLLFLAWTERTPTTEIIYYAMAIGSCLCVTKDEWVHKKVCTGGEMWLHAVLFILHPLTLFVAMNEWEDSRAAFVAVAGGVTIYLFYQIIYWNLIEVHRRKPRVREAYSNLRREELYEYFGE